MNFDYVFLRMNYYFLFIFISKTFYCLIVSRCSYLLKDLESGILVAFVSRSLSSRSILNFSNHHF